jgi:hypothetical protein
MRRPTWNDAFVAIAFALGMIGLAVVLCWKHIRS